MTYVDLAAGNSAAKGFIGAATANGKVFFAPYHNGTAYHGVCAVLDIGTGSVSYIYLAANNSLENGFRGVYVANGKVYFLPNYSGSYNKIVMVLNTFD